jgi:hypothetical protein
VMGRPAAATLFEDYIRVTRAHIEAAVKLSSFEGSQEQFARCEASRC